MKNRIRLASVAMLLAGSVNQAGLLLRQRDGVLQPLNAQPLAPLSAALPLSDGRWLTVGLQGVRLLTSEGTPAAGTATVSATATAATAATDSASSTLPRAASPTSAGSQP